VEPGGREASDHLPLNQSQILYGGREKICPLWKKGGFSKRELRKKGSAPLKKGKKAIIHTQSIPIFFGLGEKSCHHSPSGGGGGEKKFPGAWNFIEKKSFDGGGGGGKGKRYLAIWGLKD